MDILKDLVLTRARQAEGSYFFDCTNTTGRILDVLEQERPEIILLDEVGSQGTRLPKSAAQLPREWTY